MRAWTQRGEEVGATGLCIHSSLVLVCYCHQPAAALPARLPVHCQAHVYAQTLTLHRSDHHTLVTQCCQGEAGGSCYTMDSRLIPLNQSACRILTHVADERIPHENI